VPSCGTSLYFMSNLRVFLAVLLLRCVLYLVKEQATLVMMSVRLGRGPSNPVSHQPSTLPTAEFLGNITPKDG
jgi:hypothetical protein